MTNLQYSIVIEATEEPNFFCFYSPDLSGFTGVGTSVEDCIAQCGPAMDEYVAFLKEEGLPVPPSNPNALITVQKPERAVPAA